MTVINQSTWEFCYSGFIPWHKNELVMVIQLSLVPPVGNLVT